jgi:hypothetical protein
VGIVTQSVVDEFWSALASEHFACIFVYEISGINEFRVRLTVRFLDILVEPPGYVERRLLWLLCC